MGDKNFKSQTPGLGVVRNPNYHAGHRDRMRDKFERDGIEAFNKHEVLEMLLYYCIPRRDTNEIAHELLARFNNSLSAVFNASVQELTEVNFISRNTAILLKMMPGIVGLYLDEGDSSQSSVIKSFEDAIAYFTPKLVGLAHERLLIVYLDNKNRVIACQILSDGSVNAAKADMNKIITGAVTHRAASCILAHNHPHGDAYPSVEDGNTTKQVIDLLRQVGIDLFDHIVVGERGRAVSMASTQRYGSYFSGRSVF